ncbi:hypothetical protein [Vibrio crassostreae]|uniref:hypothetical protein n=1 Tax=Vibrio crassostreae TaxID=246167 RepID=UPI001B30CAE1|nr:hypothetical protein [Vibrio crassostreae]
MLDTFECNHLLEVINANEGAFTAAEISALEQTLQSNVIANSFIADAREATPDTIMAFAKLSPVNFESQKLFGGHTHITSAMKLSVYPSIYDGDELVADLQNPYLSLYVTKRHLVDAMFDRNHSDNTPITYTNFNGCDLPPAKEFVSNHDRYNNRITEKLTEYNVAASELVAEIDKLQEPSIKLNKGSKSEALNFAKTIEVLSENTFTHTVSRNRQKMESDFNYIRGEIISSVDNEPQLLLPEPIGQWSKTPFNSYFEANIMHGRAGLLEKAVDLSGNDEFKSDIEPYLDRTLNEDELGINKNVHISNGYMSINQASGTPFIHGDSLGVSSFMSVQLGFACEELGHLDDRKVADAGSLMELAMTRYQFMDLFYGSEAGVTVPCSLSSIFFHQMPKPKDGSVNDNIGVGDVPKTEVQDSVKAIVGELLELLNGSSNSLKVRSELKHLARQLKELVKSDSEAKMINYQVAQGELYSNLVEKNVERLLESNSIGAPQRKALIDSLKKL